MPDTPAAQPPIVRLRHGVPFCLAVFVALRLALSLLAVIGVRSNEPSGGIASASGSGAQPATPGSHNAVDGLVRWDAGWFLQIANRGYRTSDGSAAIFPGYPILIRAADEALPGGIVGAALLVSNGAFFAALVVLHGLTTREFDEPMARRTVALLAAFPSSFFFLAPYSESVFLLATLLAFWWAGGRRWWAAGAAGVAAALTRGVGIFLAPALLLEVHRERGVGARRYLAAIAPLLGSGLYAGWWLVHAGDALQPLHAQASWQRQVRFPLLTLVDGARIGLQGATDRIQVYWTADLVVSLVVIVALVVGWRWIRPPYAVYAALSVLLPLCIPLPERPLLSLPRFVVVLFPAFWILASRLGRRGLTAAIALGVAGQVLLVLAFMNWWPVY